MPKVSDSQQLLYSFDGGNGACKGLSSDLRHVVQFEPTLAPLTTRRGLHTADEKPTFSLRVGEEVWVAGIDDVFAHGKRTAIRRLNSLERYTSADYFRLLGMPPPVRKTQVALPVVVYAERSETEQLAEALDGLGLAGLDFDS